MTFGAFSRHWTVWKAAWQAESSQPTGASAHGGCATEFLPAVLEIQQAPPSPIGRALLWTILAAFTAGTLWTTFGWIDIVATAQGKIIPSGYSKIDPALRNRGYCLNSCPGWTSGETRRCADRARFDPQSRRP